MLRLDVEPELFTRIAASPAVQDLAGSPRFDIFMHEGTTPEQWIGWLDTDFDNRQHLVKTAFLSAGICEIEGVDEDTTHAVVLTSLVHDAAESVVGDRNIHKKQAGDDEEEVAILESMVADGRLNITVDEFEIVCAVMLDKHGEQCQTEAGKLFDMSEIVGYIHSGVTAWRTAHDTGNNVPLEQRELLKLLPVQVFARQLNLLWRYEADGKRTPGHVNATLEDDITTVLNFAADPGVIEAQYRHCLERGISEERAQRLTEGLHLISDQWRSRLLAAA